MLVLIADDHEIVCVGLRRLLDEMHFVRSVHTVRSFYEADRLMKENAYQLIILDFNMPGLNSFTKISKIKTEHPNSKLLIYSAYPEETYAIPCLHAGADGYLSKECPENEIKSAFDQLLLRGTYVADPVKAQIKNRKRRFSFFKKGKNGNPFEITSVLSQREMDVCNLLLQGNGILEISNMLHINASTVSTYKSRIFTKLAIKNLADLIALRQYQNA